ncbi:AraC family transcriptional regulator (plasmid) [Rhizobium leguminosarum]|uniref:helix-turn-helix transcriptional regulator n=1 Tax=Rhizobium leguminosarum TaxID=384 RepID=UPI001031CA41|nr:AraC family transcriptional regulator [Rhizobium leguminosarum]TAX47705.1 AraC family transcriptional regulator [Rhizobium leguminosarum]TAY61628.1 AraC family transcriptional regulator [Rhizobium leguminosarum]
MVQMKKDAGRIRIWRNDAIAGVELLRASGTQHHFPKHFHDAYAIHLHERGTMAFQYGQPQVALTPGNINVLAPGVVHMCLPVGEQALNYRCLFLSPAFLQYAVLDPGATRLPLFERLLCPGDIKLFQSLGSAHRRLKTDNDTLEAETLLTGGLAALAAYSGQPHVRIEAGSEPRHVTTIREFLNANYDRRIALADLARLVGLNPVYLVRSFRSSVGLPPHAYQRQLRLSRAQQLLRSGTPPAEVAETVGFADQSHLSRLFKQTTGVTPADYAKGL